MIFVGGSVVDPSETRSSPSQAGDLLMALLEHPVLVSSSHSFKAIPERKFSVSEQAGSEGSTQSKCVYVFQREYATVDPELVDLVGTDEATTCVGIVIRNRKSGMISVAHMDSPTVVDGGLTQMLSLVHNHGFDVELDVHLIGGFDDSSPKASHKTRSKRQEIWDGYSLPLCIKIIDALWRSRENFHIQTLCVLGHNTRRDSEGNGYPIFNGFLAETSTGRILPASFDRTTRCPEEIVRRIRVSVSYEDPSWDGRLLETYDTRTDQFKIAPCTWTMCQLHIAMTLQHLSDSEILRTCSTSPSAEAPDFLDNIRRCWDYLIHRPDWRETFPMKQPRVFKRTAGGWTRCTQGSPINHPTRVDYLVN
ncbi:protein N-terminal asparagine amidohydrolase-like isoform X2 [Vitis riparia]|uniref:protein N-terminal asparagine amidohydrolase-like isoform X2 n=1 Tax=Vitis riparia TaxID=96939 RepID=UPI00155AAA0A|nr:protein N-terminal asparagine amidohydrolase-like isoform X2 [Vitis riparia]